MNKTFKRALSALLVLGVLTLPCGLSLDREALAESIVQPVHATTPPTSPAIPTGRWRQTTPSPVRKRSPFSIVCWQIPTAAQRPVNILTSQTTTGSLSRYALSVGWD